MNALKRDMALQKAARAALVEARNARVVKAYHGAFDPQLGECLLSCSELAERSSMSTTNVVKILRAAGIEPKLRTGHGFANVQGKWKVRRA